jgi:hypothetical protein
MKAILILWFLSFHSGTHSQVVTLEYESMDACRGAITYLEERTFFFDSNVGLWKENAHPPRGIEAMCLPSPQKLSQ